MVIESIPKAAGMAFAVVVSLLVIVLLVRGKFNRRMGLALLVAATLMGFLVFAPMLPNQFQVLLLGKTKQLGVPVPLAGAILFLFVAISFVVGRSFCGYACPIGAVQELVYKLPGKKLVLRNKKVTQVFRLASLAAFLVLTVVFSLGMLNYLGVHDFFYLDLTWYFLVFLAILILGVFLYRPFCRLACPYGAILSLAAIKGIFKLRRNGNCNECGECELVCPTNEAGANDLKQECYLCHRCVEACKKGGISYGRAGRGT
ncbi:MAG: 4Fe-4S binding protein [Dehalococcoidia bacterium]|nr:4Fe-4S binding protein [Dehalococcoidia bacterium]